MEITKELVAYVAELSRIRLNEGQTEKMQKEMGEILKYMDVLNSLDTEGIEPMSHVFDICNVMRKDEAVKSFDREQLLKNAPVHTQETVIVPSVNIIN